MKNYMVGTILEDGTMVKGYGEGGYKYFLNPEAFYSKKGICYIDANDFEYTYNDFIALTRGNHQLAESYFESVSGTCIELLLDEDLMAGEVIECVNCDKYHFNHEVDECPYCCNENN